MKYWKPVFAAIAGIITALVVSAAASADAPNPKNLKALHLMQHTMRQGGFLSSSDKQKLIELAAGSETRGQRSRHLDNIGGPDDFGYAFVDNQGGDTATFEWIELRDDPETIWINDWIWDNHDDGIADSLAPIGFEFPFYGEVYSHVRIGVNGHLQFVTENASFFNECLPHPDFGPTIFPYWDDLHLDYGGITNGMDVIGYRTFDDYFVVEFDSIGHCCEEGTSLKFEVLLFRNGSIKMQYHTLSFGEYTLTQTIGIQESESGTFLEYVCDDTGLQPLNGLAIWFTLPHGLPQRVSELRAWSNVSTIWLTWTDPIADLYGSPIAVDSIQISRDDVPVASVPPGEQVYTETTVPQGTRTYSVRAFNDGWASAASVTVILIGNPAYSNNFDITGGHWMSEGGWAWGAPTNFAPHSVPNVWGNRLSGEYMDNECQAINLNLNVPVISADAQVEFFCWYETESFCDGVNFQASVDGGTTWHVLPPAVHPYDIETAFIECLAEQPMWSGTSGRWQYVQIPIGQFIGQTPRFRFVFGSDGSVTQTGFLFDDFVIWGLQPPAGVPVSGTITLDGGSGAITQAAVRADGLGSPSTLPAANGNYTIQNVETGLRTIMASLVHYEHAVFTVDVPAGGLSGQNLTLRRLPPPMPTGLTAVQDTSGRMVSLDWNNSPDPLVDYYRVYRKLRDDTVWTDMQSTALSQAVDSIFTYNVYQYSVTAVDSHVTPPAVESNRSMTVQVIYGAVPPSALRANGRFDDHIRLTWVAPGAGMPPLMLQHDDGSAECWTRISHPGGLSDYFAVRFHTNDVRAADYPLPVRACNIYMRNETSLREVKLCPDAGNVPDVDNPLAVWTDVAAEQSPGWISLTLHDPVALSEPQAVWIVCRMPGGETEAGIGTDHSAGRRSSFFSRNGTNWELRNRENWMCRLWLGGEDDGRVFAVGTPSGYPAASLPVQSVYRETPTTTTAKTKSSSALRGPVAESSRSLSFASVLSDPPAYVADAPASVAPDLEFRLDRRERNTLDDPDYYIVYRNTADIAHVAATAYDDTVAEGISYAYYVTAHYPNGEESSSTNSVTAMAVMPPGMPTEFFGTPVSNTDIELTWSDPVVNANGTPCLDLAGLQVFRDSVLIGTMAPGVGQFTDTPPVPNRFTTWTIRAFDEVPNAGPVAMFQGSVIPQWLDQGYDWVDIDTVGIPVVQCDDCLEGPFTLGFSFPYYGHTYDSVWISSNGFLTFTSTFSSFGSGPLPNTWEPNNAVYAFATDLNPFSEGTCLCYADSLHNRFIVSWVDVPHFGGQQQETFQIVIGSDGSVVFNYQTVSDPSCTIGVENETGTIGIDLWEFGPLPDVEFIPASESGVMFWGPPPAYANVSGHVAFDGGSGNLTDVIVSANGVGHPTTQPDAAGSYALQNVMVGNRILSAALDGYHRDTLRVTIPDTNGLTNQNFVLRRLDPPAPTGLTVSVNSSTGRDSLHWDISPDPLVDRYYIYRKLRDDAAWVLRQTVETRNRNWAIDTLLQDGIYLYRVSAADTNVIPPEVESPPSASVQVIFGEIPPVMLSADGDFDDKIRLRWYPPGTEPSFEVYYDSVDVDSTCVMDGLGFIDQFDFAWFTAHYQGNGPVTIQRVKTRHYSFSTPGAMVQMGVFEDAGDGTPTFTPLSATDTVITDPTTWLDVALNEPVTVPSGSFFVGIRQVTAQRVDIGLDFCAAQQTNTFFATSSVTNPWERLEDSGFPQVLCIRAIVIGDMGGDVMELNPTPAVSARSAMTMPSEKSGKHASGKTENAFVKSGNPSAGRPSFTAVAAPPRFNAAALNSRRAPAHPHIKPYRNITEKRGRRSLDDVIRYRIYRDGQRYDSVAANTTVYDNINLSENHEYTYYVTAVYDNNEASPPSNSVTEACNMAPETPANMSLSRMGNSTLRIRWDNPTLNADGSPCVDLAGIHVYRDGVFLANVAPGVGYYLDSPPSPTTYYTWEIQAYDEVPNLSPLKGLTGAVQSDWYQVEYEWFDVWEQSTPCEPCDDCIEGPFELGFPFSFYETDYNSVYVCSNGFLSFFGTSMDNLNQAIPGAMEPNAAIYGFWDDLVTWNGGCRYFADPANGRFIATWVNCWHWDVPGQETFQIVLQSDGAVQFNYAVVGDPQSSTIGVENANGTVGIQMYYAGSGDFAPVSGKSVKIWGGPTSSISGVVQAAGTNTPIAAAAFWVADWPDTAYSDLNGNYELRIPAGTHNVHVEHPTHCDTLLANIVVNDNQTTVRNLLMRAPTAQFSHTSLTISTPHGVNGTATLTLGNAGGYCPLEYSITDTSAWLSAEPAIGMVNAGQSVTIIVHANVAGIPVNSERHSTLIVSYNAPGTPQNIPVDLFVLLDADDPNAALPTEFAYHSNYPNPFNAITTLAFDVPQESPVEIIIYNLNGQEAARPVTGVWSAGRHRVAFDAGRLPSGMYIVRMAAGDFRATGKMLLLK